MTTNNFPNIGYTTLGYDNNYFQKFAVTATTFGGGSVDGYRPDAVITFSTSSAIFTALSGAGTVEYSFNGQTVHGELTFPASGTSPNQQLIFNNRVISKIWFRVQSGSSGTINVSVQAWGLR